MRRDGTPTLWWDVRRGFGAELPMDAAFRLDGRGVADLVLDGSVNDFEFRNLPCWRPPWPVTWMEWRGGDMDWGALVQDDEDLVASILARGGYEVSGRDAVSWTPGAGERAASMRVYGRFGGDEVIVAGVVRFGYRAENGAHVLGSFVTALGEVLSGIDEATAQRVEGALVVAGTIVGQAFSMCSCRNVATEPYTRVEGSRRARKEFGASGGGVVWSRIVVDAARGAKADAPPADGAGATRTYRAHFVRGHFADYTSGVGLFGRWHGRFWVPLHRRGDEKAAGRVIQEYATRGAAPGARP